MTDFHPNSPPGQLIQKLEHKDFHNFTELIKLFERVFEMENFLIPDQQHLQLVLEENGFIVLIASIQDKVVAGLTAYTLKQYYSIKPLCYIYDLAVEPKFQRKGIGKQLIEYLKAYCKSTGMAEMYVQADLEDDYAIDFYRSTGALQSAVVNFSYPIVEG